MIIQKAEFNFILVLVIGLLMTGLKYVGLVSGESR
mgnify:CR=1 FL=1